MTKELGRWRHREWVGRPSCLWMRLPLPPTLGPEREEGEKQGPRLPSRGRPCALCAHLLWQGPFVHLSVMIAAYLGRLRTKAIGESEVRGS